MKEIAYLSKRKHIINSEYSNDDVNIYNQYTQLTYFRNS